MNAALDKRTHPTGVDMRHRWAQLVMGIICMAMVANLQYGWTLFVNPMSDKFGWSKAAIQVAFSIFVLCETWLVPVEGWLMDKFGPRPVVLVGRHPGWAFLDHQFLRDLSRRAVLFRGDRRDWCGLRVRNLRRQCAQVVSGQAGPRRGADGCGLRRRRRMTVIPIANMVKSGGYDRAFFDFGMIQGIVVVVLSLLLIGRPRLRSSRR